MRIENRDELLRSCAGVDDRLMSDRLDHVDGRGDCEGRIFLSGRPDRNVGPRSQRDVLRTNAGDDALPIRERLAERQRERRRAQQRAVDRCLQKIHRWRADELRDECVRRTLVHLPRRADLLNLSVAQDGDAMSHRHRLDLIVRHIDAGRRELLLQFRDLGARLHAQFCVEIRERLIEEKHRGLAHDGATDGDALTLPAGEIARLAIEQMGDAEDFGGEGDASIRFVARDAAHAQTEFEILAHAHVRIERVALKDHGDVAIFRREIVDDASADRDGSFGHVFESGDHPQRRRLPAA